MDTDPYLIADNALTPEERKAFLDCFTAMNPHWRGAHVADVLSALHDSDAHCGLIEQFMDDRPEVPGPQMAIAVLCAVHLYRSPSEPTREQVGALVERFDKAAARD